MGSASGPDRPTLIALLGAYRRPGTPVFAYHYRRLPEEVLKSGNAGALLGILTDQELPAKVRDHAAGALGQIGCKQAVPALIDALSSAKTRRGAATALGLLKARQATEALAALAPRLSVARWAHEEVSSPASVAGVVASLRDGQLRRIGSKIAGLKARARAGVAACLMRTLRGQLSTGRLASSDRWIVTSLQHLAPAEAAGLIADALRSSIRVKDCCGCLCKRTTWAAAAIGSPDTIPALVEMIAKLRRPQNVQQAAVCIEKIAKAHPDEVSALLRRAKRRLAASATRFRKQTAATPRRKAETPWDSSAGTPRWRAASTRALNAVERVLRLAETL
jgi:hypothetical protein